MLELTRMSMTFIADSAKLRKTKAGNDHLTVTTGNLTNHSSVNRKFSYFQFFFAYNIFGRPLRRIFACNGNLAMVSASIKLFNRLNTNWLFWSITRAIVEQSKGPSSKMDRICRSIEPPGSFSSTALEFSTCTIIEHHDRVARTYLKCPGRFSLGY